MAEFKPKGKATGRGPVCPNHGCPLLITHEELQQGFGQAPCEISGAGFDWQADSQGDKTSIDINGNVRTEKGYNVTGDKEEV